MRRFNVAMAVVVTVLAMVSGPAPCQAQWAEILPAISSQITSLWQNNELELFGKPCFYKQQPKFVDWELYYQGEFSCPKWTKIKGSALKQSRTGIINATIEDFIKKAKDNGLVMEEDAKSWLEGYKDK